MKVKVGTDDTHQDEPGVAASGRAPVGRGGEPAITEDQTTIARRAERYDVADAVFDCQALVIAARHLAIQLGEDSDMPLTDRERDHAQVAIERLLDQVRIQMDQIAGRVQRLEAVG